MFRRELEARNAIEFQPVNNEDLVRRLVEIVKAQSEE